MQTPCVLWIGDERCPQFADAAAWLSEHTDVRRSSGVQASLALLADPGWTPAAIILAAARPGAFSPAEVYALRAHAPLARIVALLGSWCEGQSRGGTPWLGARRVAWHQWRTPLADELVRLASGRACGWTLPDTATDDERLLNAVQPPVAPRGRVVAILSPTWAAAEALADALRSDGYASLCLVGRSAVHDIHAGRCHGADAVIWDAPHCDEPIVAELRELVTAFPMIPVLALVPFPRTGDVTRLTKAGASAIVAKPLCLGDLFRRLDRVIGGGGGARLATPHAA